MSRLVIDTNVYVSAAIFQSRAVERTLRFAHTKHTIFQSPDTLRELARIFLDKKFDHIKPLEERIDLLQSIKDVSQLWDVRGCVDLCRDPKDNMLFALSHAVGANYLISGDKDVLDIPNYGETITLKPQEFIYPDDAFFQFSHAAGPVLREEAIFIPPNMPGLKAQIVSLPSDKKFNFIQPGDNVLWHSFN